MNYILDLDALAGVIRVWLYYDLKVLDLQEMIVFV